MSDTVIRSRPFTLTMRDYLMVYIGAYLRLFVTWPSAATLLPVILGPAAVLAWIMTREGRIFDAVISVSGILSMWAVVIPGFGLWRTWAAARGNKTLQGSRVATLTDQQFSLEGEAFSTHQAWGNFSGVVETKSKILLRIRSGLYHVVPVSAFDDEAARRAFVAGARQHIRNAGDKTVGNFYGPVEAEARPAPGGGDIVSPPFRLTFGVYSPYFLLLLARATLRGPTLLILVLAFIGLPAWLNRDALAAGDWHALTASATATIAFVLVFPFAMLLYSWLRTKKRARGVDRYLGLSREAVRSWGQDHDVTVKWDAVHKVEHRFGLVLLWVGTRGALFVPASTFADKAEADAFYQAALGYWRAAAKTTLDAKA